MTTIHLYIGLPGSGKTYRAKKAFESFGGIILDDDFDPKAIQAAIDEKPNHIYITHPHLCFEDTRTNLISFLHKQNIRDIKLYCFENDVEKAWTLIKGRSDGRLISKDALKDVFSRGYTYPAGVEIIPIWNPE